MVLRAQNIQNAVPRHLQNLANVVASVESKQSQRLVSNAVSRLEGVTRDGRYRYFVQKGDSLELIAARELNDARFSQLLLTINRAEVRPVNVAGQIKFLPVPGTELLMPSNKELAVHRRNFFLEKKSESTSKLRCITDQEIADRQSQGQVTKEKNPLEGFLNQLRTLGNRTVFSISQPRSTCFGRKLHENAEEFFHHDSDHYQADESFTTLTNNETNKVAQSQNNECHRAGIVNGTPSHEVTGRAGIAYCSEKPAPQKAPTAQADYQPSVTREPESFQYFDARPDYNEATTTLLTESLAASEHFSISPLSTQCRLLLADQNARVFTIKMQVLIRDQWKTIASYESAMGRTTRKLNYMDGQALAFAVELPHTVAREMAREDFYRNWREYYQMFMNNAIATNSAF